MSSDSYKNVINKIYQQIIYLELNHPTNLILLPFYLYFYRNSLTLSFLWQCGTMHMGNKNKKGIRWRIIATGFSETERMWVQIPFVVYSFDKNKIIVWRIYWPYCLWQPRIGKKPSTYTGIDTTSLYIHWKIYESDKIKMTEKWYAHQLNMVIENNNVTILKDMLIFTNKEINKSDAMTKKEKKFVGV